MEDINLYLLTLRQSIELEYYKLKSTNDNLNKLEINNIIDHFDQIQSKISDEKIQLEKTKSNNLFLSISDIENLLSKYDDGTYGILNYFNESINTNTNSESDPDSNSDSDQYKIIEYISDNNYEYHNKQSIVNKLINNNKMTTLAINESYGILFLYMKKDSSINNLHKVYLLKNNDINYLNEDESDEKIITKIYEIGSKITLKDEIYNNNFEPISDINTNIQLTKLLNDKKQLESLYKLIKKYNKYIEDNISKSDIKQLFNNFSFVNILIKKISDPTNKQLNIQDIIKFNYMNILDRIKISNRLEQSDYDTLIERYLDDSLDQLVNNSFDLMNIDIRFRPYMNILFEILIRIYIDNHHGYKSFCLSKSLIEYLKFSNLLADPETNTITLKRRHWNQLLETKDNRKIISSILYLLKTKTHTLEQTFKYFESIFMEIKIKY